VISYGKYGRKISLIVKWFGKYRRKQWKDRETYHFTIQHTFIPYFLYLFTIFFHIFQIFSLLGLAFIQIFHIISHFNFPFFHIFHIISRRKIR
jgi:hypothetical protein